MDWQPHHFITGWLCLDLANTVVYGNQPGRRIDRLQGAADSEAWRSAAGVATLPLGETDQAELLRIRGCVDDYFRSLPGGGDAAATGWTSLARLYGEHAEELHGLAPAKDAAADPPPSLPAAVLHSAVALAFSPDRERIGECAGCGWLFVDRTRNRSKRWCTSRLCGNRAKARRHYARTRSARSSRTVAEQG